MILYGIVAHNALALLAIIMVALAPLSGRRMFVLVLSGGGALLLGLLVAGIWVFPPLYGAGVYAAAFLLAAWRRSKRRLASGEAASRISGFIASCMLLLGCAFIWTGVAGRLAPEGPFVDLASPHPRGDGFCVISGGNSLPLNAHYHEGPNTAASFEKHSVDVIKRNPFGFRTVEGWSYHPKPLDPARYAIFESPVFSPCSGEVLNVENDKPDNLAGFEYRSQEGANLVELSCKNTRIVLAHFRRGSITVKLGQRVETGELLGRVGNSGNTEEPHLHIHAETLSVPGDKGRRSLPVPMRFDGRYLSRGDCL